MDRPRPLNLLDMTCIGVNAIIGSSIFLFPGRLAGYLGPASILSFGLTGLLLVSVALCFAEASTHYDRAGGPYLYAREAFGDRVGYGIGWMCWATSILGWAAVADAIAVYLGFFGPAFAGAWVVKATAAAVILVLGAVNYRGAKLGAWTSDFLTAAKLIPLALFVLIGLPQIRLAHYVPFAPHGWKPMGGACFLAYFAFQGFEVVPVPAGEAENPGRNVPLAVLASMVLSALVYMAVQSVAVGIHPGLAGSERPLAEAAARIMGPAGASLMVLGAVLSTTGYNAGAALGSPRYLVALCEDGHLPPALGSLHERFNTPHRAVLLTTGLALAAALLLDFNRLVDIGNIVVCAQYLSTCAAIPRLRRLKRDPGGLRLPGGLAVPVLGILATLWLGAQGGRKELAFSGALLALGFGLRAWTRRAGRGIGI